MQSVRIYEMQPCRMAVSDPGDFAENGPLERFNRWFSGLPRGMFPRDYLSFDAAKGAFVWMYRLRASDAEPEAFEVIDFPGGLYAVATGTDGAPNDDVLAEIGRFLAETDCFEIDPDRASLGNIITSPSAAKEMGWSQMDYYTPIRAKG